MKKSRYHVSHFSQLPDNGGSRWPGVAETFGTRTALSRPLGLERVGVHHDRLRPGERSSQPHAEPFEEECVYVLAGDVDCQIEETTYPLGPGAFAAFAPATGVKHTFSNTSERDVELLVIGERRDHGCEAIARLISLWREPDPQLLHATFADDAPYEIAGTDLRATGPSEIEELLARRRQHYGADTSEIDARAVGWTEGFLSWHTTAAQGTCVLALEVRSKKMVTSVTEYIVARTGRRETV